MTSEEGMVGKEWMEEKRRRDGDKVRNVFKVQSVVRGKEDKEREESKRRKGLHCVLWV